MATSPAWVIGLVSGLLFGAGMCVFLGLTLGGWLRAAIFGAAGGALFGLIMGPVMSHLNRRLLGDARSLPLDELRQVNRASVRGPVPADPGTRAAALALAQRGYAETVRTRRQSLVSSGGFLLVGLVMSVTQSPWWLFSVAFWVAVLLMTVLLTGRQRRRIEELSNGSDNDLAV